MMLDTVKIDVVTSMLISIAVAMLCEGFRRSPKEVFADILIYFDSMGRQFARVVTLVIAGQTFAHGLKTIGLLDTVIEGALAANVAPALMVILMVIIITLAAILMAPVTHRSSRSPPWCQKSLAKWVYQQ